MDYERWFRRLAVTFGGLMLTGAAARCVLAFLVSAAATPEEELPASMFLVPILAAAAFHAFFVGALAVLAGIMGRQEGRAWWWIAVTVAVPKPVLVLAMGLGSPVWGFAELTLVVAVATAAAILFREAGDAATAA